MVEQEKTVGFLGSQVMLVDPEYQGYGLLGNPHIVGYANKFHILSGQQGLYITPYQPAEAVLNYYAEVGVDTAHDTSLLVLDSGDGSLVQRVNSNPEAFQKVQGFTGSYSIPYLQTEETEAFARTFELQVLSTAAAVDNVADKKNMQELLQEQAADIRREFGLDIAIPFRAVKAGDEEEISEAYDELSDGGKEVGVIVPKSASALGINFFAEKANLVNYIAKNFLEGNELLLEERIRHTMSPSMQGRRVEGKYEHLYFGSQAITYKDQDGSQVPVYISNHIPFAPPQDPITEYALRQMQEINEALGETISAKFGIDSVIGFDTVVELDDVGKLSVLKVTEANLHLPGSLAGYAAIHKMFPEGFEGVAINQRVSFVESTSPEDFLAQNQEQLVRRTGEYGIFPLAADYPDRIDIMIFARDFHHGDQILRRTAG